MIHLLMLTARHSAFFHLHLFPHAVSFDRFLGLDIEGLLFGRIKGIAKNSLQTDRNVKTMEGENNLHAFLHLMQVLLIINFNRSKRAYIPYGTVLSRRRRHEGDSKVKKSYLLLAERVMVIGKKSIPILSRLPAIT